MLTDLKVDIGGVVVEPRMVFVLQMRDGYLRLQALFRSRILTHRFTHLRGKMMTLQVHVKSKQRKIK